MPIAPQEIAAAKNGARNVLHIPTWIYRCVVWLVDAWDDQFPAAKEMAAYASTRSEHRLYERAIADVLFRFYVPT